MNRIVDQERAERLRQALDASGWAAFLAWHPEEIVLTTSGYPHMGMTLCLYPRQGEPVVYVPGFEPTETTPAYLRRETYPLLGGPGLTTWDGLHDLLRRDLERCGPGPVGVVPTGVRHAPPGYSAEAPLLAESIIRYLLTGRESADATEFYNDQALRKTAREVEVIRNAHAVAAHGLRTFYQGLRPGLTEAEVAAQVETAIQAQSGKGQCALARGWAFVQSGPNTLQAGTYSRSSGRALAEGELVVIELATCVDGYWSDLTRVGVVGQSAPWQQALIEVVRSAQQAAIAAIRPGATHMQVDQAARAELNRRGYGAGFTHMTGHHVGFRYHDAGPLLDQGSEAPLQEGMVVTVEPGVYGPDFGGGLRIEENVLVGPSGPLVLSPMDIQS
jgi:Xaa-Pro aminopeptidase